MKNKVSIIAVMSLMLLLTACGGQTAQTGTTTANGETTVSEVASNTDSVETVEGETGSVDGETDVEIAEGETETVEGETEAEPVEEVTEDTIQSADSPSLENIDFSEEHKRIAQIIEDTISSNEHAVMEEVTDSVILKEFFLIDVADENIEEAVVYQCPMSAQMSEIIVIKATDVDAAKEILEARKQKAIETDAWYPQDQENAEASIVGTEGNFAYYIINSNAATDEGILVSLLK